MALGTLGSVVFEASSERVRTFTEATHTTSARWDVHEIIGAAPVAEFGGRALRKLSLAIRLDRDFGVDPEAEAEEIRDACEAGTVLPLLLGGEPRGDWVLLEVAESWRRVAPDGSVGAIDLSLSLQEYR